MREDSIEQYLREISAQNARIDERTLDMQVKLDDLKEADNRQDAEIQDLRGKVDTHDLLLGGLGAVVLSTVTAVIGKFANILHL